jgi:hypothetical protein
LPTTGTVVEQLLEAGWWIVLFGLAFLLAISGFLRSGSRKRSWPSAASCGAEAASGNCRLSLL